MLINDFYNFEHSYNRAFDVLCFHNAVRQVLEYYGVDKAIFFINSALNIVINDADSDFPDFKLGLSDNATVLPSYCHKVNCYNINDFKDFESLYEDNKRRVHSGTPIITAVDTFYLNYSINYQKSHNLHANIFCGYDENSDRIDIVDWFSPWFFKGQITYDEFTLARKSNNPSGEGLFAGYPTNCKFIEIESGDWNADIDSLLYETIELTLQKNNAPKRGVSGLKHVLNIIKENSGLDNNKRNAFLKGLFNKFYIIKNGLDFSQLYFQLSYDELKLPALKDTINCLENIKNHLLVLSPLILKTSYTNSEQMYEKTINRVSQLIQEFENFIESIVSLKEAL